MASSSPVGQIPVVSPPNEPNVMTPLRDQRRRSARLTPSPGVYGSIRNSPDTSDQFETPLRFTPGSRETTPKRLQKRLEELEDSASPNMAAETTPEKFTKAFSKLKIDKGMEIPKGKKTQGKAKGEAEKDPKPTEGRPRRQVKAPIRFGYDDYTN